jgi:hypothetical protein
MDNRPCHLQGKKDTINNGSDVFKDASRIRTHKISMNWEILVTKKIANFFILGEAELITHIEKFAKRSLLTEFRNIIGREKSPIHGNTVHKCLQCYKLNT